MFLDFEWSPLVSQLLDFFCRTPTRSWRRRLQSCVEFSKFCTSTSWNVTQILEKKELLFLYIELPEENKLFYSLGKASFINGQSSRCCTARGSSTRFSLVGPTKVKACKSFLFTVKFPCIENKEHLIDFVITSKVK